MEQTFEEMLLDRLRQPVKTKTGQVATDEDGAPITAERAMIMSIVSNATRGDLQAATFIRNLTRRTTAEDTAHVEREQQRTEAARETIRRELEAEGLYSGQQIDIERVAQTLVTVERLEEQMQQPDFRLVETDIRKDGTQTAQLSKVKDLHDRYSKELRDQMRELRQLAQMRLQNIKKANRK